jgi:hypothetical protein
MCVCVYKATNFTSLKLKNTNKVAEQTSELEAAVKTFSVKHQ